MKLLVLTFTIIYLSTSASPCEPFGIRMNYGRNIYEPNNPERLGIRFNTKQECKHIELVINQFMIVHCPIKRSTYYMHNYNATKKNFTTYIHICSLSRQLQYEKETQYNLYNVAESKRILPSNIKIRIKDPLKSTNDFTFLHLADWGPITKVKAGKDIKKMKDITKSLTTLIDEKKIDCAIINGDIGYELNSNQEHHNLTMQLIEKISSRIPVIYNRGNHELNKEFNSVGLMFEEYFELYDLQIFNATGVTIGSVFLAIVDPINLLLPRKYNKFTEQALYSSISSLKVILEKARTEKKTIIGLSHYPLICGFPTPGHCIPDQQRSEYLPLYVNLKDLNTLMLKYRVPIMLSGHVHTYERTYPFIAGYRSKNREKYNYTFDEQNPFYIQVIDGVCGSNNGIYESYANKQKQYIVPSFIASYHVNSTGYGLLHTSKKQLRYEHYSVSKGDINQLTDHFTIKLSSPKQKNTSYVDVDL